MTKISACIITYNEVDRIEACLKSLSFCDEIIVVDSGSTDGTVELAKTLGANVLYRKFDGFRSQKQYAVEQAKNDWILALDADEMISPQLLLDITNQQILFFKEFSSYSFPRCDNYQGKFLRHGIFYPHYVLRLFNRNYAGWHGNREIHERVVNTGKTKILRGDLLHYPYRNYKHELEKLRNYAILMANHRYANGARASYIKLLGSPFVLFFRGYIMRLGFLDGMPGLIRHINNSMYAFHKELFLFDLQSGKSIV